MTELEQVIKRQFPSFGDIMLIHPPMATRKSKRTVIRLTHQGASSARNSTWAAASKESRDLQASDLNMADNMAAMQQELAALQAKVAALTASQSSWSSAAEDTCQSVLARRVKDNTRFSHTLHYAVPVDKFPPVDNIRMDMQNDSFSLSTNNAQTNSPEDKGSKLSAYDKILSDHGLAVLSQALDPQSSWLLLVSLGLSNGAITKHETNNPRNITRARADALIEWRNNKNDKSNESLYYILIKNLDRNGRKDMVHHLKTVCKKDRYPDIADFQ